MSAVLAANLPYWAQSLLRVLGGTVAVLLPAGTIVYLFLFKMMSFMQSRLGPMEAGPYGSMQLFAEVGKWLQKEDIAPERADLPVFRFAPLLVLVSTFLLVAAVPFGPDAYFTQFDAGVFYVLAVSNDAPFKTIAEMVAYAKANPSKLSYGSAGIGSTLHLGTEFLKRAAGINIIHVPYKGAAQATTDLVGGQIQVMIGPAVAILPLAQSGKVRALAVTTSKRSSAAPKVPTLAEEGVPNFHTESWNGVFAPKGTPKEIVDRMAAAIADVRDELGKEYTIVIGGKAIHARSMMVSLNPSHKQQIVGRIASATADDAVSAVDNLAFLHAGHPGLAAFIVIRCISRDLVGRALVRPEPFDLEPVRRGGGIGLGHVETRAHPGRAGRQQRADNPERRPHRRGQCGDRAKCCRTGGRRKIKHAARAPRRR